MSERIYSINNTIQWYNNNTMHKKTRIPNYEQYGSSREGLQTHLGKINVQDFSLRESM